ncbi:unnamed protein product, partial [Laminaria digitata]
MHPGLKMIFESLTAQHQEYRTLYVLLTYIYLCLFVFTYIYLWRAISLFYPHNKQYFYHSVRKYNDRLDFRNHTQMILTSPRIYFKTFTVDIRNNIMPHTND